MWKRPAAEISIFTGAGISGALPAGLPMGNQLRNEILKHCCWCFGSVLGQTPLANHLYSQFERENWKLEFVVGRLAGLSAPDSGVEVLKSLAIELPNEAHMLLAVHLLEGGLQATLNFDEGIETAFGLIAGTLPLKVGTSTYGSALAEWRATVAKRTTDPLQVIATEQEFEDLVLPPLRPTLLKIHGSLKAAGESIRVVEPVVTDDVEMSRLSRSRVAALGALTSAHETWITGYGGLDIDVYSVLIRILQNRRFQWISPQVAAEVERDLAALDDGHIKYSTAVSLLRERFPGLPPWPEKDVRAKTFRARFDEWRLSLDPIIGAAAVAWMLLDVREYDMAVEALSKLVCVRNDSLLQLRLADAYYHRSRRDDKERASRKYLTVGRSRGTGIMGGYALGRWAATARPLLLNKRGISPRGIFVAFRRLAVAILFSLREAPRRERLSSPLAELGHTLWRITESLCSRRLRYLPTEVLDATAGLSISCFSYATFRSAGKQSVFARLQTIEASCLRCGLRSERPQAAYWAELLEIEQMYLRLPDPRGIANVTAAKALWVWADGNKSSAEKLLQQAEKLYRYSSGEEDPAGRALVARRREMFQNF